MWFVKFKVLLLVKSVWGLVVTCDQWIVLKFE